MHISGGAVYRRLSGPDLHVDQLLLFNYLIDGYCHLLFICYTLTTQYYHNITQLDVKFLHLIRYSTLPSRGPQPSLNHNNTLYDIPTYILLKDSMYKD